MDDASSPPKMKRKKRGQAAVDSAKETSGSAKNPSSTPYAMAPRSDHILAQSSSTNTIIKGLIQQSIDGILLQSALDVIRISSTVFLHRFLIDLSRRHAATSSMKSTTTTTGNIEDERALLQAMRQLISANQDYQFLDSALDERWEEQCVAALGQKKRKSTLLSDIPRGPAPAQKESRRPPKKTQSSKKTSNASVSLLIPGALDSLGTAAVEPPMDEGWSVPAAAHQVVWDQEDYD
jgi:hypothetical protein